jgi:hypothetical protein
MGVRQTTMDVSDLRKRILRALEDGRKDQAERRTTVDAATRAYEKFLSSIAVPLMRQAADVLKAEGQMFTVQTPADSVRLSSQSSQNTFLEFVLDTSAATPQVLGRLSLARARQGQLVEERPLADKPVDQITEEDVSAFLIATVARLVTRS